MSADLLNDRRLRHVEENRSGEPSLRTYGQIKVDPEERKTKLRHGGGA